MNSKTGWILQMQLLKPWLNYESDLRESFLLEAKEAKMIKTMIKKIHKQ